MPRRGLGQQVQRSSSGWIPHDRITSPQILSSRSLPLHRPRRSALRYPAVAATRSPIHTVQRDPALVHEPLPGRPTCFIGSTPITHLIHGIQIPIVNAAPPTSPSRGFLHQRFADAGPGLRGATFMGPPSANLHVRVVRIAGGRFWCTPISGHIPRLSGRKTSRQMHRICAQESLVYAAHFLESSMKFIEPNRFNDRDAAARKLVEIANAAEPVQDGRIHIEKVNGPFLYKEGGSPAEYGAGMKLAIESGWLWMYESGTHVKFTRLTLSCRRRW